MVNRWCIVLWSSLSTYGPMEAFYGRNDVYMEFSKWQRIMFKYWWLFYRGLVPADSHELYLKVNKLEIKTFFNHLFTIMLYPET